MNVFSSILKYRCPKCRSTKMYIEPFEFKKPLKMHERCDHCKQLFEPEPGFYFGSMYISYMLCTAIMIPLALLLVFGFGWTVRGMIFFLILLSAISYFKILRLSRSIWIHLTVKYRPELKKPAE